MDTIEKYLESNRARKDVAALLNQKPMQSVASEPSDFWLMPRYVGDWIQIELQHVPVDNHPATKNIFCYYRSTTASSDEKMNFIVSDLGDGWKNVRLSGADWHSNNGEVMVIYDAIVLPLMEKEKGSETNAPWGTIELRRVSREKLPNMICAVLLATYRVSKPSKSG